MNLNAAPHTPTRNPNPRGSAEAFKKPIRVVYCEFWSPLTTLM